jgi:hypothetical protein
MKTRVRKYWSIKPGTKVEKDKRNKKSRLRARLRRELKEYGEYY